MLIHGDAHMFRSCIALMLYEMSRRVCAVARALMMQNGVVVATFAVGTCARDGDARHGDARHDASSAAT